MLNSIRLLEDDNRTYSNEVDNLKSELTKMKEIPEHTTKEIKIPTEGMEQNLMWKNKNKILILCDKEGRNLGPLINTQLRNSLFNIETIIKPGASFECVIGDIVSLAKNYTKSDDI
ncbi:hypothetical protein JTB14_019174 [Gonioctena quinquepunctata]|nr:hypothetical protein JTB14_019174 [Gonioctena quinquepunctata]